MPFAAPSAASNDFADAIRIWMTCFGDNESYTRFLFDRLLSPNEVLFHRDENGRPDAMACLKTFSLAMPGGSTEGAYLFGVATLPECRGRGIASALLLEAEQRMTERGVALTALVPGGPELFEFYAKRAYETAFSVRRLSVPIEASSKKATGLEPVRLESLREFRRRHFGSRRMFVDWDESWLRYVDAEARALGGGTFALADSVGEPGYVVCYPYRDLVIVKEYAAPEERFDEITAALAEKFPASEYRFHLPGDFKTPMPSEAQPFAMVRWLDADARKNFETKTGNLPYMAHVLDGPTLGVVLLDVE